MYILGIESSCDETSVSVSRDGREILSNVVNTQIPEHRKFGGVVPEIASRRHCENILAVCEKALEDANVSLKDIDAIAVTYAPGLIGALLVGVSFAKGLAMVLKKPLIPVHHLAGHIAGNYITHRELKPPYLCLIVSGGHTHIAEVKDYNSFSIIGRTRDDSAGECFDKCARAMGLPYPGGIEIQRAAKTGDPESFKFPKPRVAGNEFDFSFSGLKTNVINKIHNAVQKGEEIAVNDIAASLQETISDILVAHTIEAAKSRGYRTIAVAGGVSANKRLREKMGAACEAEGFELYFPELKYCGDNGAMIACAGYYAYKDGIRGDSSLNAKATLSLEEYSGLIGKKNEN